MKAILSFLFLLLAAAIAFADLTIVQKVSTSAIMGQPAHNGTVTMRIKGSKARIDHKTVKTYQIIDLSSGNAYLVDPTQKRVTVLPIEMMKQAGNAILGASGMNVNFQKTGRTQKIGAYRCEEYTMNATGMIKIAGTHWITTDVKADEYGPFREFAESFLKGVKAQNVPKGVSIRSETRMNLMGQNMTSTTEVLSISRKSIPDS